jgi:uncharacterized protein (DUF305 family)
VSGRRPSPHRRFAAIWGGLAAAGVLGLGLLAFFGGRGHELPHVGGNVGYDQSYMRRMTAHHVQGIELARMAVERAQDSHLRALARLMTATQKGEIAVFDQWWRSWFGGALPPAGPRNHTAMPGMLSPDEIDSLRWVGPGAFDPLFVRLMSIHHEGAIAMADEAIREAGDPRLKLMSRAIRHEQSGEIELMHGARGWKAMKAAVASLLSPSSEGRAERGAYPIAHHRP